MARKTVRLINAFSIALAALVAPGCGPASAIHEATPAARPGFVARRGTEFVLDGKVFPVAGVNNHYLTFGSRQEVLRVLDDAVAMNANVVRTFLQPVIGSLDGSVPTIWPWRRKAEASDLGVRGAYMLYWDPGKRAMAVNDGPDGLQRLDFLLLEARRRRLKLIIALLDFWDYTGGAQQMRAWYGSSDKSTFFFQDPRTVADYKAWAAHVLTRVNSLTGVRNADDPTIMAWELMNEPNGEPAALLRAWIAEMSAHVKSLDPDHLVATGHGNLYDLFPDIEIPAIDFGTWHGYPVHWGTTPMAINAKIGDFCALAERHGKPMLFEEFGYARAHADHVEVYRTWLETVRANPSCAGWVVWRLVSRQDSGRFPLDRHDQFDVRNDGGPLWQLMRTEAERMRARPGRAP